MVAFPKNDGLINIGVQFEKTRVIDLAKESAEEAKKITLQVMKEVFKEAEKQAKKDVGRTRPGLSVISEKVSDAITVLGPIVENDRISATLGAYSRSGKLGVEASRKNDGISGVPFDLAVALNLGKAPFKLSWVGGGKLGAKGDGSVGVVEPASHIANAKYQAVTSETLHGGYTKTSWLDNAKQYVEKTTFTRLKSALKGI